ncbi:MAG TPA: DUF4388 domain-containing protein [Chloroflexota bacterium]|nr:DUF4388 domain-containing protein [Chloroflexota bacterium]
MLELNGSLSGIGLPALINLLSELRETGVLRLNDGDWRGDLAFEDGVLIAASLGTSRGLDALAACVLMLGTSDFSFVEASTAVERNIHLEGVQLRQYLDQLPTTTDNTHPPVPTGTEDGARATPAPRAPVGPRAIAEPTATEPHFADAGALGVCPLLGYADDRNRHYSRPTALHRCYSSAVPSPISNQEQRDLCLSGRYETCPRFHPIELAGNPANEPPAQERTLPPGVAARLAVAHGMTLAGNGPAMAPRRGRTVRGPLLIAGGAVLGLIFVSAALLLLPLQFQPQFVQPTPTPVVAATVAPAAAALGATRVPLALSTSAPQPTSAPTPSPAKPTSAPTTTPAKPALAPPRLPTATAVATSPNVLLDIRFARAAQRDWLENAPFAGLRDGAYRFYAQQAKRFVAVAAPVSVPDDVVVSATLRKTGGPPGGGYGLIVRAATTESLNGANQTFEAYVLEAGDLGEFGIWRREEDRWIDLVPWTRSQAVRQGGSPNELLVRATGTVLAFTINGVEVARVDDDVLTHGGVGVFAGGDNNEVALDRFTVQIPN